MVFKNKSTVYRMVVCLSSITYGIDKMKFLTSEKGGVR